MGCLIFRINTAAGHFVAEIKILGSKIVPITGFVRIERKTMTEENDSVDEPSNSGFG
jgi:hypothetical protein